jgi:hypothetical protein
MFLQIEHVSRMVCMSFLFIRIARLRSAGMGQIRNAHTIDLSCSHSGEGIHCGLSLF